MHLLPRLFLYFIILIPLSACQQALLPEQVAEKFWLAVKDKDHELIKHYSTSFWQQELDQLETLSEIASFSLGTITINNDKATIETTLMFIDTNIEKKYLFTHLVKNENLWKVNFNKTIEQTKQKDIADAIEELSELGELLSDGLNQSLDELNKALPEIEEEISEFEKKIESGLPKLQQKVDELLKKLEELLSSPKQQEETDSGTKEI